MVAGSVGTGRGQQADAGRSKHPDSCQGGWGRGEAGAQKDPGPRPSQSLGACSVKLVTSSKSMCSFLSFTKRRKFPQTPRDHHLC